jgi:nucleoside-diphosphate-sugar epimerase
VAELLLEAGHRVSGVDNLNDSYDVRLKDRRLHRLLNRDAFSFQQLDILDRAALETLFSRITPFDAVFNLAARAGVRQSEENPWLYFETNAIGTLNLLDLCRRHAVQKFVLASTSSLYGASNSRPFSEDADTSRPLSPYAASKGAAEAICHTHHHLYGIDVTVFRYFTVYGPMGRPDMSVLRFIQWVSEGKPVEIYGDGRQSRDFTFVDDIARGTIAGLRPLGYQIINLGSDRPVVLMDVLRLVERLVGREAQLKHYPSHRADVQATWANISRASEMLDWQPSVRLEEGIQRTVDWYRENHEWAKNIRVC